MKVVVITLIMAIAGAAGASPVDPCTGELDAVSDGTRHCRSPVAMTSTIAADAVVVEAPMRDPAVFPGEVAFVAVVTGMIGGGALAAALLTTPAPVGSNDATFQRGTLLGGIGMLSLAGLLGAAAVGLWVFNPATGTLQLPIFAGESL